MTPEQSQDLRIHFIDEMRVCLEREHSAIGAILRTHLFAEHMLNAILRCNLDFSERELENCRFTFAQKIKLVIAQEKLSSEIERSLNILNKVRNKCAHKFDFSVNNSHWEEIFEPFIKGMPYDKNVSGQEDEIRWIKWAGWLLGVLFPTADVYGNES